jgi:23S rRNA pseudouridine955/2504/2580 synthase
MYKTKVAILNVDAEQAGQRLDNFLLHYLKNLPKSRIYNILRKGEVRINKKRAQPSYRLQADDQIRIPPVWTEETVKVGAP